MIYSLEGGLTAHAELSLVDGMKWVAFEFDDSAFPVFGQDPAAGRAFATGGGIPFGVTCHHVIGSRYKAVKGFSRVGIAAGGKREAAHTGKFEEGTPFHLLSELQSRLTGMVRV